MDLRRDERRPQVSREALHGRFALVSCGRGAPVCADQAPPDHPGLEHLLARTSSTGSDGDDVVHHDPVRRAVRPRVAGLHRPAPDRRSRRCSPPPQPTRLLPLCSGRPRPLRRASSTPCRKRASLPSRRSPTTSSRPRRRGRVDRRRDARHARLHLLRDQHGRHASRTCAHRAWHGAALRSWPWPHGSSRT